MSSGSSYQLFESGLKSCQPEFETSEGHLGTRHELLIIMNDIKWILLIPPARSAYVTEYLQRSSMLIQRSPHFRHGHLRFIPEGDRFFLDVLDGFCHLLLARPLPLPIW